MPFPSYKGIEMKAVQCWDDGVVDDVRLIEILRKYGARASFNLNAGLHKAERYSGWRYKDKDVFKLSLSELPEVYAGFTVANHTLHHPTLPKIPAEDALREIAEGRDRLEQIMGYEIKGFAYPNGAYSDAVKTLIRDTGHVYARTTGTAVPLSLDDPMAFHPTTHFLAPDFWDKFEQIRASDGVFYFWGHSYEIMKEEDWRDFDQKIQVISERSEWADLLSLFA